MFCPICKKQEVPMAAEAVAGVEVDRCSYCRGVVMPHGQLRNLISKMRGNGSSPYPTFHPSPDYMTQSFCLECNQPMTPHQTAGDIRFDWCKMCGSVFVDSDTMTRILARMP